MARELADPDVLPQALFAHPDADRSARQASARERFSGFDGRSEFQADDVADFPQLAMRLFNTPSMAHIVFSNCVGPVELSDKAAVHRDVERLTRALAGHPASDAFLGAILRGLTRHP